MSAPALPLELAADLKLLARSHDPLVRGAGRALTDALPLAGKAGREHAASIARVLAAPPPSTRRVMEGPAIRDGHGRRADLGPDPRPFARRLHGSVDHRDPDRIAAAHRLLGGAGAPGTTMSCPHPSRLHDGRGYVDWLDGLYRCDCHGFDGPEQPVRILVAARWCKRNPKRRNGQQVAPSSRDLPGSPAMHRAWDLELERQAGHLAVAPVALPPLPDDAPTASRAALEGFRRLVAAQLADGEKNAAPYSVSFTAAWCDLPRSTAGTALHYLRAQDALRPVLDAVGAPCTVPTRGGTQAAGIWRLGPGPLAPVVQPGSSPTAPRHAYAALPAPSADSTVVPKASSPVPGATAPGDVPAAYSPLGPARSGTRSRWRWWRRWRRRPAARRARYVSRVGGDR